MYRGLDNETETLSNIAWVISKVLVSHAAYLFELDLTCQSIFYLKPTGSVAKEWISLESIKDLFSVDVVVLL